MTSLDFLYIALGGGFVLLIIFLCVLLLHITLVLRDVNKMTSNVKDVTEKVRESVFDPLKTLSEMTAGIGFAHHIVEKIREKYVDHDCTGADCASDDGKKRGKKDKKSDKSKEDTEDKKGFSVHKLNK
jgi:ABC-type transport system involved in cytochrome bd biosynthesis fused ATPase/permease subunit